MSALTQPDLLAHLREKGPSTIRELVESFAEDGSDRRELQHLILTQLIRLQRRKLVTSLLEPAGRGKIYSAVPEDVAA